MPTSIHAVQVVHETVAHDPASPVHVDVVPDFSPKSAFLTRRGPWRLNTAFSISLLAHALLLSVALGGEAFGLPGLNLPWKERRLGANDLRVKLAPLLAPAPAPAAPAVTDAAPGAARQRVIASANPAPALEQVGSAPVPVAPPAPAPLAEPAPPPAPAAPAAPSMKAAVDLVERAAPLPPVDVPLPDAAQEARKRIDEEAQERALEKIMLEQEQQGAERLQQANLMAQEEAAREAQRAQEAARAGQVARSEAARLEVERQALARQETLRREAQQDAERQERERLDAARTEQAKLDAARTELAKLDAARKEQAQLEAALTEQARIEAARKERAQAEAAQREQERPEAARQDALEKEAARQEQAQLDAARREQAQREAARREQAQLDAARQEQARLDAARQDAARQEAGRQARAGQEQAQRERAEQEAQREERLRAIGKQLDKEATQRDAAANRPSPALTPTTSSLRRGWLFGRADANADLVQYAQAMSRKIEMNMTLDMLRDLVKERHTQPVVTLAIRADGSVEKVTFVVSSGVPAIDEAIRQVVASQAPYGPFPPALARQYDVIEIRRTWIFDVAIRLE